MTSIQPARTPAAGSRNGAIGIVLGHGFTGSPHSIQGWADYLTEQGFTVAVPLLPGHGTRWQDLVRTPWQQWYDAYERAWDELARERSAVFAAGLSMGGTLALRLAARRPVAGVAVVNPALSIADPAARYAGLLKYAVRSVKAIGNDIKRPGMDEQAYPRTPVAAVHQLRRLIADTAAALPAVTAPTLVFRSAVDHVVPASSVELIRRRIGGQLEVVPLPDSYHVATLDNDAETIFARTAGFLAAGRPADDRA
ncbi:alpha/beta fold hydrolase [Arthrobacter sp. I2-34]|uniref:Alpha/beta fold hydrolase n=1 Tax=Arthrobacter hankyongi TaxID=2904801 RepID=A0ABS9LAZ2_9MICC|nr:alpha/beta fold hydrolase [Arthrobacter hankyongi]MCG2623835.1 alpha/beta fold hydrolase [Arthrobacter hankyongi]